MAKIFEAKLNIPQEYIDKVKQTARAEYGSGPTRQDMAQMGQLMSQIIPSQQGHEEELTELGKRIIQKFYGPVIQGVELDVKIVMPDDEEKLEMAQKMLQNQEEEEQSEEGPEIELELPGIEHDIDKRKLINNVMQGEAQNVHTMMYDMKDEVTRITGNPRLLDLYMQFLALNKKFDWDDKVNLEQMMEQAPEMANAMETEWEDGEEGEGDKPKIKARVLDLPMLIHETVKGIYELIAAGAIDPDPVRAQKVLAATDTLTDEQEDIRFGPFIAKDLRKFITSIVDKVSGANDIPNMNEFVFGKMVEIPSQEFVQLINNILTEKPGPEKIITKIINDIIAEHKSYKASQLPSFQNEPEEDENLPAGAEEFSQEEDNELERLIRNTNAPKEKPTGSASGKPNIASMGLNQLNFELNKAIDAEDWNFAKEIQQTIERKENSKNGVKESFGSDVYDEEDIWFNSAQEYLISRFHMSDEEAADFLEQYSINLYLSSQEGFGPDQAVDQIMNELNDSSKSIDNDGYYDEEFNG